MVGAHYLLAVLAQGEPRGLPGAVAKAVAFQRVGNNRPFDDIVVSAVNLDGTAATLEIQAKRTLNCTESDPTFADIIRRLWLASQKPEFNDSRYELAVAIAQTTTKIERDHQEVLNWARQHESGAAFCAPFQWPGFASKGKRDFLDAVRAQLIAAGAPADDETVWRLLRRFKILVFDFEAPGSAFDHFARERARLLLIPAQADRAQSLWSVLIDEALARDAAGGEVERAALLTKLTSDHGFKFEARPDLLTARNKLREASNLALADIKEHLSGFKLPRMAVAAECDAASDNTRFLKITGNPGVGKSAVLKHLANRLATEGILIVLTSGRIIPGGWTRMADAIGCGIGRDELLSELALGGPSTLFIDNIDRVEDEAERATVRDLIRGVVATPGWNVVATARANDDQDWRAHYADEIAQLGSSTVVVNELTDDEADVLRLASPTLSALLSETHPARSIARNLFHLSRLVRLADVAASGNQQLISEVDLAAVWWKYAGGRSELGLLDRLRALRLLAARALESPASVALRADDIQSSVLNELVQADTLRHQRLGATVAFRHDVLRDWAIGTLLHEEPGRIASLPLSRPAPNTLARGFEIATRLALETNPDASRWNEILRIVEDPACHGSWRRPALLAVTRSERAVALLDRVEPTLMADGGRRLSEILRLVLAVESEPLARRLARLNISVPAMPIPPTIVVPTSASWGRLLRWLLPRFKTLPNAAIPDVVKFLEMWLAYTHQHGSHNRPILEQVYAWLTQIEQAVHPPSFQDLRRPFGDDLSYDQVDELEEQLRLVFLSFSHLVPDLAKRYVDEKRADHSRHHYAEKILKFPGSLAQAAPAALVDFALAELIPPPETDDEFGVRRSGRDRAFELHDTRFYPNSPAQGPFLELLDSAPEEGLRLVRTLVEHATNVIRDGYLAEQVPFPKIAIPFGDHPKEFFGDAGIFQWARGGTGGPMIASALMALEAWGHRQIEAGEPFETVLHQVLGPSGSSAAFLCVALDLVLSHWEDAKTASWPMLTSPELLMHDRLRAVQDTTGVGRLFLNPHDEPSGRAKVADLTERPSRKLLLLHKIGDFTVYGPQDLHAHIRQQLLAERTRVNAEAHPTDNDLVNGLKATAAHAIRLTERANWVDVSVRLADGQIVSGTQYQPPPEELAVISGLQQAANANLSDLNLRLGLQKAVVDRSTSTADLVGRGIAWARSDRALNPKARDQEFERDWYDRTVVMAAALAARDYEGDDRAEIERWARTVLDQAAASDEKSDNPVALLDADIGSNKTAIATVGLIALYLRRPDEQMQSRLFDMASRLAHSVRTAIAIHFAELEKIDERQPRAFIRIMTEGAIRPRRRDDAAGERAAQQAFKVRIARVKAAETDWLLGTAAEPPWCALPPWPSRPKRRLRIGGGEPAVATGRGSQVRRPDDLFYAREFADVLGLLDPLLSGSARSWIVDLARHLVVWTVAANNGADGEDGDRENLPYEWDSRFFPFLGNICAWLTPDDAKNLALEPMARLHEEPFLSAVPSFLIGFDRVVFSNTDPDVTGLVHARAFLAERMKAGRNWRYISGEKQYTAEMHLGHALTAMFFHPPRYLGSQDPRPYLPAHCKQVIAFMPALTGLAKAAPCSGYIAALFLNLIETSPDPALFPFVLDAVEEWVRAFGIDADFWTEKRVGSRVCAWLDAAAPSPGALLSRVPEHRDRLLKCLDIMVRAGVAQAQDFENRAAA